MLKNRKIKYDTEKEKELLHTYTAYVILFVLLAFIVTSAVHTAFVRFGLDTNIGGFIYTLPTIASYIFYKDVSKSYSNKINIVNK